MTLASFNNKIQSSIPVTYKYKKHYQIYSLIQLNYVLWSYTIEIWFPELVMSISVKMNCHICTTWIPWYWLLFQTIQYQIFKYKNKSILLHINTNLLCIYILNSIHNCSNLRLRNIYVKHKLFIEYIHLVFINFYG